MRRRFLSALAMVALSGCGSDEVPTRAKFVEALGGGYATELQTMARQRGLDADELRASYEKMLGCFYDRVETDDLLALIDDDTTATFDRVAAGSGKECEETFRSEVTALGLSTASSG